MGVSEKHSGDAPLVLNPKTGKITTQWKVIFDDWFSTMTIEEDNLPDFHSEEWAKTFGTHAYAIPNEDEDAKDFKPVRKLQWKERSTDEDQHRHINRVRNVQEVLNQPHQRYQPERQNKRAQAEQLEHQSLAQTLDDGDVVLEKSLNSRSSANEGDTKMDNSSISPNQEGASVHWEDSPSSVRGSRNTSPKQHWIKTH